MIRRQGGFLTEKVFEMVREVLHTLFGRTTLDSNRCVGVFAGKFLDGFPGKVVLFVDVLIGQRINFAINKVNLRV